MKKLLGILMILILIAGVFVSCSQDKIEEAVISGEELLDVSFDASSGRARDLVVDTPTFDDGDYIWYYTAQKDDTTGFNTGEKSVKTPVKDPTTAQTVADRKGLAGAVISGLSQGYWDFGLYAYVPDSTKDVDYDYSSGSVAWQGSVSHFLLVKGAANVVDVTVSPSTEGKGWLVVDLEHITVDDDPITAHPGTSLVYTVTPVGGTASVDISEPIDAGAYVVKVVCTGSNIDYAEDSIVVNVYSGLTRTVSGWIGELTTSAVFGDITGEIIEASTGSKSAQELKDLGDQSVDFVSEGTVPVTASLPATAAVALLPEVEPGTDQDLTLTLNVKSDTTVQTETTKKYDITLVQKLVETTGGSSTTTVSNVTSPLTKYLTATLTIDKNLSAVTVTHSGEDMTNLGTADEPSEAQIEADAAAGYPGFYKYNAATGELKLMTMKFSPFQVSFTKPVDGIAAVYHGTVSTETLVASCKSLTDAIELAVDGDVVKVLQSTSYGSDAKISKAIKVDVSDENVSVVDITSPEEAIALAGRGYKGTYADDVLTITKTPITDAVARIGDLYFKTLQEAIDVALSGEEIVILKDIKTSDVINSSLSNLTINLNGKTLEYEPLSNNTYWGPSKTFITVAAGNALSITDNSTESGTIKVDPKYTCTVTFATVRGTLNLGKINVVLDVSTYQQTVDKSIYGENTCATNRATVNGVTNYGTVNIDGTAMSLCPSGNNGSSLVGIKIQNNAVSSICNAEFDATAGATGVQGYNGSSNQIEDTLFSVREAGTGIAINGANATIDDCTIDMSGENSMSASSAYGIRVNKSATASTESDIVITGKTKITADYTGYGATCLSVNAGAVVVDGNISIDAGDTGNAVAFGASALSGFENSAQLELKSGNYKGDVSSFSKNGTMVISGGSYSGDVYCSNGGNETDGNLRITGGSFSGGFAAEWYDSNNRKYMKISGGSFAEDPCAYVPDGHEVIYDETNKVWIVNKAPEGMVAKIGSVYYATIEAAIDAAGNDDVVELLRCIDLSSILFIDNTVTIEGHNHDINNTADRVIRVRQPNTSVSLRRLGIISKCEKTSDVRGISVDNTANGSSLILDGCRVSASFYAINITKASNLNVTIKNGTVSAGWAAINSFSNDSIWTIESSTLKGLNDKSETCWNNFNTITFDGDTINGAESGQYGTGNTISISHSTVVSSETNSNIQHWIGLQYGASDNTVIVDSDTDIIDLDGNDISNRWLIHSNTTGNTISVGGEVIKKTTWIPNYDNLVIEAGVPSGSITLTDQEDSTNVVVVSIVDCEVKPWDEGVDYTFYFSDERYFRNYFDLDVSDSYQGGYCLYVNGSSI